MKTTMQYRQITNSSDFLTTHSCDRRMKLRRFIISLLWNFISTGVEGGGCRIYQLLWSFHAFPNERIWKTLLIQAPQAALTWVPTQNFWIYIYPKTLDPKLRKVTLKPLTSINRNLWKVHANASSAAVLRFPAGEIPKWRRASLWREQI